MEKNEQLRAMMVDYIPTPSMLPDEFDVEQVSFCHFRIYHSPLVKPSRQEICEAISKLTHTNVDLLG